MNVWFNQRILFYYIHNNKDTVNQNNWTKKNFHLFENTSKENINKMIIRIPTYGRMNREVFFFLLSACLKSEYMWYLRMWVELSLADCIPFQFLFVYNPLLLVLISYHISQRYLNTTLFVRISSMCCTRIVSMYYIIKRIQTKTE